MATPLPTGSFSACRLQPSLPGDFGFDPLGFGSEPESLRWFAQAELMHGRWAMLAAAGILVPEVLHKWGFMEEFSCGGRGSPEPVMVLRTKEIKTARLAMLAFVGFWFQAVYTGQGPLDNLFAHLADPGHCNIFSIILCHVTSCRRSRPTDRGRVANGVAMAEGFCGELEH
uniref:Chlorophyll a-b binding protein, chloroplastic n=1 Tax=Aegilops tauschii TaxID=37682 RepID=N1R056_AEGTA